MKTENEQRQIRPYGTTTWAVRVRDEANQIDLTILRTTDFKNDLKREIAAGRIVPRGFRLLDIVAHTDSVAMEKASALEQLCKDKDLTISMFNAKIALDKQEADSQAEELKGQIKYHLHTITDLEQDIKELHSQLGSHRAYRALRDGQIADMEAKNAKPWWKKIF